MHGDSVNMFSVRISKEEHLALNSREFHVRAGGRYRTTIRAQGTVGKKCSAYLAIVMLDASGREIDRKIRWLNDFSGKTKIYSVTAEAPAGSAKAVVAYRINTEIAVESEWAGMLTEIEEATLAEAEGSAPGDFDNILDAHEAKALANMRPLTVEEEDTIEKNLVWVFGAARSGSSWLTARLLNHKDIIVGNDPLIGSHIGSLAGKIINVADENYRIKIDRTIDVYENEAEYFFSAAYRHVWMPYLRKMVLQRLFCQYPACLKKPVVIKEPNGSLSADVILQDSASIE